MNLVFFHGTLQRFSCWDPVIEKLRLPSDFITTCPDFYHDDPENLESWYQKLISQKIKRDKNVLIGYSLGGRFAIELYKRMKKDSVSALVLISMDPGIDDPIEIEKTLKRDQIWADKFLDSDWNLMIEEWNDLPVFSGIKPTKLQEESNFTRQNLAKLWMLSSKANNPSLWSELSKIDCPVLLISGKLDKKFNLIAHKMKKMLNDVEFHEFEDCGHRVPWETEDLFSSCLKNFLLKSGK